MNGKDILLKTLRGETTDRLPWVPFTGVHAGSLIGVDADAYLKSADHIVAGLEAAMARYQPDGLPVVFDLQLEAEVLGCTLAWAQETPPSVATHPLDDSYDLASLPPFSMENGRFPAVFDAVKRLKSSIGADTALFGLLTGPLTLALHCGERSRVPRRAGKGSSQREAAQVQARIVFADVGEGRTPVRVPGHCHILPGGISPSLGDREASLMTM